MKSSIDSLGSDELNITKVREIILVIIAIIVIGWYMSNYPSLSQEADLFYKLALGGGVGIIASFVISKTELNFNVPLKEKPLIDIGNRLMIAIFILSGLFTFFIFSKTAYRISAPTFQVVDLGLGGEAILYLFSAMSENWIFFAVVPGLVFAAVYYLSKKNSLLSVLFTIILTVAIFVAYHTLHYGFTDVVATFFVGLFALEMSVWMVLIRDITYVHIRHIANNLGILIFTQMSVQTLFIKILYSWVTWASLGVVAIIVISRYRDRI